MESSGFGKQVNHFRNKKNLTLVQCADQCGINKDYLCKIESGVTMPKPRTLLKICNVLEVSPDTLFQYSKKECYVYSIEHYLSILNRTSVSKTLSDLILIID